MDRKSADPRRPAMRAPGVRDGGPISAPDDDYDLRTGFSRRAVADPPPPNESQPAVAQPPAGSDRGRRTTLVAGGVLVVAIAVIAVLAFRLGAGSSTSAGPTPATTTAATTTATTLPVSKVYQLVVPSVVVVTTSKGSLGSGVIVTDTGTIVTADHVVSDGGSLTILFSDGTKSSATIASANPKTDIAELTPATLPEVVVPAVLGGSLTVGADVTAIGNPLGFVDSTTSGIVSGLDRTAKTDVGQFSGLIQFDAAVNPGSSGGPLLDSKGLVVGIVVSIADPGEDDSFAGIGFAVPIAGALGGGGSGDGPGGGPQI